MRIRFFVCTVTLLIGAVGCGSQSRALRTADEIGVSKLRDELQTLISSPAGAGHEIPRMAWPASIQRFQPVAVQRHMGGVLIVASTSRREQHGLLVMLDPADDPGGGGSGVIYESLGNGLFWCREKIRFGPLPPEEGTNR